MTTIQKIQSKLYNHRNDSIALIKQYKQEQKKIVFTNGCFDIVHAGHIDYLSKASDLGGVLIVGLNSDASVARLKGENRPIHNQKNRMQLLASLFFVDAVIIFEEETPYELVKLILPDVLVKGGDYKAESVVGYDVVKNNGGKTVILDLIPGHSTSLIEKKIIEQFKKKL
jgi:rfaE bifunctional protein nucleotidyltransferase chain/domain